VRNLRQVFGHECADHVALGPLELERDAVELLRLRDRQAHVQRGGLSPIPRLDRLALGHDPMISRYFLDI